MDYSPRKRYFQADWLLFAVHRFLMKACNQYIVFTHLQILLLLVSNKLDDVIMKIIGFIIIINLII